MKKGEVTAFFLLFQTPATQQLKIIWTSLGFAIYRVITDVHIQKIGEF